MTKAHSLSHGRYVHSWDFKWLSGMCKFYDYSKGVGIVD